MNTNQNAAGAGQEDYLDKGENLFPHLFSLLHADGHG
jgi:hypothetical protein